MSMDWLSSHFSIGNSSSFMVHISWHPSVSQNSGKKKKTKKKTEDFNHFSNFCEVLFGGNKTQKRHMSTSKCYPSIHQNGPAKRCCPEARIVAGILWPREFAAHKTLLVSAFLLNPVANRWTCDENVKMFMNCKKSRKIKRILRS